MAYWGYGSSGWGNTPTQSSGGAGGLNALGSQQLGNIGGLQNFAYQAPQVGGAGLPQSGQLQGIAGSLNGAFAGNLPYANQALTNAFDPQQALYKQNLADLTDATRAGEAARGISMSPYGAGVEANAIGRFQNDWQDRQVQRQNVGASTATNLQGQYQSGQEAAGRLVNESGQLDQNNARIQLERYGLQGENLRAAIAAMQSLITSSRPTSVGGGGGSVSGLHPNLDLENPYGFGGFNPAFG